MSQTPEMPSGEIAEEVEIKVPSLYKVYLHNDDYTTMDFVIEVLTGVFHKEAEDAAEIMMTVHKNGIGLCGVYPREIAEFCVGKTLAMAREAGFPLLCTMEEA